VNPTSILTIVLLEPTYDRISYRRCEKPTPERDVPLVFGVRIFWLLYGTGHRTHDVASFPTMNTLSNNPQYSHPNRRLAARVLSRQWSLLTLDGWTV